MKTQNTKKKAQAPEEPKPVKVMGRYFDPVRRVHMLITDAGPMPEPVRSPPASRIDC